MSLLFFGVSLFALDIPDDKRDELVIGHDAGDWMDRLAPANASTAPWSTHGEWLKELKWGTLVDPTDGTIGAACDIMYYAVDTISDEAYDAAGACRTQPPCRLSGYAVAADDLKDLKLPSLAATRGGTARG